MLLSKDVSPHLGKCHTLKLSELLLENGIQYVTFSGLKNHGSCLAVFVHQFGGFVTNLPTGHQFLIWNKTHTIMNVEHEIVELLDYDGKECLDITKMKNYSLKECQNTESYKVFFSFMFYRWPYISLF